MSTRNIIIGLLLFSVIFVGGGYLLFAGENKAEVKVVTYSFRDKDRPAAEVEKTLVDLGNIRVSDQKVATFTIKNVGTRPLQISRMSSSCHCTVGQFLYQGKSSGEYGMSSVSDTFPAVATNTEATVKVIYRPYIMPVYGPVEREVYVMTNDPSKPKIIFQVTANVK
ncbi:DUF1573 domain-containing protein [Candidatus Roizmanbacteria bacterium]|nr:DUF1573 domain-containing protein [Candidatus Roizmanbacteria bacterium]